MNAKKFIVPFMLIVLFITTACDDDEAVSKSVFLTASPWINGFVEEFTGAEGQNEAVILFQGMGLTFNTDGTYTINTNLGTTESGTWEFDAAETVITFDKNSPDPLTVNLVLLTEANLTIKWTETILTQSGSSTGELTLTFIH